MLKQVRFTEDVELREKIQKQLRENNYYCPCSLVKNADTRCMCKAFRDMESGTCHCGLYVKE